MIVQFWEDPVLPDLLDTPSGIDIVKFVAKKLQESIDKDVLKELVNESQDSCKLRPYRL